MPSKLPNSKQCFKGKENRPHDWSEINENSTTISTVEAGLVSTFTPGVTVRYGTRFGCCLVCPTNSYIRAEWDPQWTVVL